MEREFSILIVILIISIVLFIMIPDSPKNLLIILTDIWQGNTDIFKENWQNIKFFWQFNIQPLLNRTELIIKEKTAQEKPEISKEFKKEFEEIKNETYKLGAVLLENLNRFINRKK